MMQPLHGGAAGSTPTSEGSCCCGGATATRDAEPIAPDTSSETARHKDAPPAAPALTAQSAPCCGGASASPSAAHPHAAHTPSGHTPPEAALAKDPVCGMDVNPLTAKHRSTFQGAPVYFCCAGCKTKFNADPARYLAAENALAKDPVCGMEVDPHTAKHRSTYQGRPFYFCCAGCKTKFEADPDRYLEGQGAPQEEVPEGTIYTCPMDPQIRQIGPGTCPICGMALEPELVSLHDGPNHELADMTRRLVIGIVLTAPIFVLEMGRHLSGTHLVAPQMSNYIQAALATPVVLGVGWPFLARGVASVRSGNLNMFTLIAIGTGVAFLYSLAGTFLPGLFPRALRGAHGSVPVYFEAAAVITILVALGQVLELRARDRTSDAIRALLALAPATALRVTSAGTDEEVPLDQIARGDLLRVRPGEKVPVDGVVTEGRASLEEALVTGESLPVEKSEGASVIAGTVVRSGGFVMRAEKVGRDTLLARIVQMVAEAQRSRAPIQRLADQVSGWFVPLVLATAAAASFAWMMFGPEPRLTFALLAAVSVLIIACPCALGLATPMSVMVGVGRGAQFGVLVRNAEALERLEMVDTLVVDKTGTLTEGRPKVTAVRSHGPLGEDEMLRLAASLERASEHPLAAAVVEAATARGLALSAPQGFEAPAGKGVSGRIEGTRVVIGQSAFLAQKGIVTTPLAAEAEALRADGATVIFVGVDQAAAGMIAIADPIKANAASALEALRRDKVRVVMLTGDSATTAKAVAARLGITDVEAEVLPERKAEVVSQLRKAGRVVAMAGDGVNDAPALALADVGIAMGTGTDVAMESAGITLLKGDLAGIAHARSLSRATMANIRRGLFFAFVYNAAGVPIAAGILYPWLGLLLSPMVAAAAMSLSSVSVIVNALMLRHWKPD